MKKVQQGFTLIELMIVVAIIGCRRALNFDPPCAMNFDPGVVAARH